MGLTGLYNSPVSEEDGINIIKYAFSKGITFFDTADVYGSHSNEILVGKVSCVSNFSAYKLSSSGRKLLTLLRIRRSKSLLSRTTSLKKNQ